MRHPFPDVSGRSTGITRMASEAELLDLVARYRAAVLEYLLYHMEHRVTALHLQRRGLWGPAETCAYHGRYKSLVRFEECFGPIESNAFAEVRAAVERELEARDAANAEMETREHAADSEVMPPA